MVQQPELLVNVGSAVRVLFLVTLIVCLEASF